MTATDREVSVFWRASWSMFALGIAGGSTAWWSMMPHGFPVDHPRFWMNEALPWAGVAMGAGIVASAWLDRPRCFAMLICAAPAVIAAGAIAMRVLYPVSAGAVWHSVSCSRRSPGRRPGSRFARRDPTRPGSRSASCSAQRSAGG